MLLWGSGRLRADASVLGAVDGVREAVLEKELKQSGIETNEMLENEF